MNLPGPPGECGGNMICNGAIVLTEDQIILFGSNSSKTASASDYVAGTTYCTALCCYMAKPTVMGGQHTHENVHSGRS